MHDFVTFPATLRSMITILRGWSLFLDDRLVAVTFATLLEGENLLLRVIKLLFCGSQSFLQFLDIFTQALLIKTLLFNHFLLLQNQFCIFGLSLTQLLFDYFLDRPLLTQFISLHNIEFVDKLLDSCLLAQIFLRNMGHFTLKVLIFFFQTFKLNF